MDADQSAQQIAAAICREFLPELEAYHGKQDARTADHVPRRAAERRYAVRREVSTPAALAGDHVQAKAHDDLQTVSALYFTGAESGELTPDYDGSTGSIRLDFLPLVVAEQVALIVGDHRIRIP